MTFIRTLSIGWRYFLGHFKRYVFLVIVVSFGLGIISLMTALADGMERSVFNAARLHYGGDVFVGGLQADREKIGRIRDIDAVENAVIESGIEYAKIVKRTNVFRDGVIRFQGTSARQKNVFGIDWKNELPELKRLVPVEGKWDAELDDESLVVSEPVARHLGLSLGDSAVLEVRTASGQVNTGSYTVRMIFKDSSIFGYYKSFVSRQALNKLVVFAEDEYSTLGLYLDDPKNETASAAASLRDYLDGRVGPVPLVADKDELHSLYRSQHSRFSYYVITLGVYVSQVNELITAMNTVSYVVFAMIAAIIVVSVSVTYRLIILERMKEIGTLRAIGMRRRSLLGLFLAEAFALSLVSVFSGLFLAFFFRGMIAGLSFDWIPGFEIFMNRGRLWGVFLPERIAMNVILVISVLAASVLVPMVIVVRKKAVECLSS